ncbi:MAG: hypothetical protein J7M34_00985 [Anaerolineae bacterium]|nr:hypothetical protein [Anaerolineae bacterium]
MRWSRWFVFVVVAVALLGVSCTPEEVSNLLTVVPTLTAPTPSATLGPPVIVDARVHDVSTLMRILVVESAQGFDRVVIGDDTKILGPGEHPMTIAQIHSGDVITVFGPPVGDGHALLALRIAVRPAHVPRAVGEPPEPADAVIARFFRLVNAGQIDQAIRLVAPIARTRQGADEWDARLRIVHHIRLLSVARAYQDTWTPNWQEYLVVAQVDTVPGGDWDPGVGQRYVDVVRGNGGPWMILDIRREPGVPVRMASIEATLVRVDLERRALTIQPKDRAPMEVLLAEHTQIVTEDGWSLGLNELQPGMILTVEGLPAEGEGILPDRIVVFGMPGRPKVQLEPAEGAIGQTVQLTGRNWPTNAKLSIYITVPTATFQPKPVAHTTADANGHFKATLTIPTKWPDGAPVTEEILNVIVSTEDFTAKARTQFHVVSRGS